VSVVGEYLADHFPTFPVLPGVLMLEALVQTSAWLVRDALDFSPSVIVLKQARNVTYKSFVSPGQVLTLEAECKELGEHESTFAARGRVGEREMLKGRLTLRHLTLAERSPQMAELDERLRATQRARWDLVRQGLGARQVGVT